MVDGDGKMEPNEDPNDLPVILVVRASHDHYRVDVGSTHHMRGVHALADWSYMLPLIVREVADQTYGHSGRLNWEMIGEVAERLRIAVEEWKAPLEAKWREEAIARGYITRDGD